MRALLRLMVVIAFLAVVAYGGYYAVTHVPGLRDALRIEIINGLTPVPPVPTPVTDPTEIAALPTSVPPVTLPPPALPPTPADCVTAAAVDAGGESVRQQSGRGRGRQNQGDNLPNGQRVNVNIPRDRVRNRVIIEFAPESTRRERAQYIQSINGRARRSIDKLNTVVVTLPRDVDPSTLPSSPIVVSISADYYVAALSIETTSDPLFPDQWALPVIGAPDVWPAIPDNTPPVTVAVIDSGICAAHPDLQSRIVPGWDFVDDDGDPQDQFGHGCAVAGIIAANGNNRLGIAGIAPNARISR